MSSIPIFIYLPRNTKMYLVNQNFKHLLVFLTPNRNFDDYSF